MHKLRTAFNQEPVFIHTLYPWQQPIWQQLYHQQNTGRLPHALLFKGVAGLGKTEFADHWAQHLLCATPQADGFACDSCHDCHLFTINAHPDFMRISPEKAGATIKIDIIRTLLLKLHKTRQRAAYQVVIIQSANALNQAAANALLKTLEEPAGAAILILIANEEGALPATIISRCQQITFKAESNESTLLWLTQQLKINDNERARLWLKIADYAPLKAVEFAQNNYSEIRNQLLSTLIDIDQGNISALSPVNEILKYDLELWLTIFMSTCLDLIRLQSGTTERLIVHTDCLLKLKKLNEYSSLTHLHCLMNLLLETKRLLRANAPLNQTHIIEQLLLSWELKDVYLSRFSLSP